VFIHVPARNLIFKLHNLKNWLACTDYGTCLKDQSVQRWNWCKVWVIFNFHNLKWLACTDYGACLKDWCRCKYFASMGAKPLPLWAQTYYIQLWAQNFCLCRCKTSASVGTKLWVQVGVNLLPLWVQQWCCHQHIQILHIKHWNCSKFIINTTFDFGHKNFAPGCKPFASVIGTKLLPLWVQVGANFLPLWAQQWHCHQHIQILHIKHWSCSKFIINTTFDFGHKMFVSVGAKILPLWVQTFCLCGHKLFTSVGFGAHSLWHFMHIHIGCTLTFHTHSNWVHSDIS